MNNLCRCRLVIVFAIIFVPTLVSADDSTLRFLFDKSERVIVAELLNENFVTGQVMLSEATFWNYPCKFKIHLVIKGMAKPESGIDLTVQIDIRDGDRMPKLKPRQKYILFLKDGQIDRWFGLQRYSQAMADELTRLAQEAKNRQRKLER